MSTRSGLDPRLIVVVDDERTFAGTGVVIYLRSSREALSYLARLWSAQNSEAPSPDDVIIDQLWLDHDLGDGDDILAVVDFLRTMANVAHPLKVAKILVHSQNPTGAIRVVNQLAWFYNVERTLLPETGKDV